MLDDDEVRRLLVRTGTRDTEAFERLYRLTLSLLLGVAVRIVGRREVAQEVVHDAYVKIWLAAPGFDPLAAHPVGWMVAVARNRAIDVVASADSSRVEAVGDEVDALVDRAYDWSPDAGDPLDRERDVHWLRTCLDELRPAERQAIVLAYHHGLSHGDLAEHLQRPLGTVKAWVRRGLASLRECIDRATGGDR